MSCASLRCEESRFLFRKAFICQEGGKCFVMFCFQRLGGFCKISKTLFRVIASLAGIPNPVPFNFCRCTSAVEQRGLSTKNLAAVFSRGGKNG